MAKSYSPAQTNPAFASANTGVAANHSSGVPSTDHDTDHPQFDDALARQAYSQDPNISGWKETADCYTHIAGKLDGWKENDDYREYFEQSRGCDGMLVYGAEYCDGDYDDNGGYPTAVGESRGYPGEYQAPKQRRQSEPSTFTLGIITRRV